MIVLVASLLLLQPSPGDAQGYPASAAELEALCKRVLCRAPTPIRLTLEGGKQFEKTPPGPMPVVMAGTITIMAGDKVFVEAEVKEDRLTNLVAVRETAHPDRTLIVSLKQDPSVGNGTEMVLEVTSPFSGILTYQLAISLPSGERYQRTSSCPLSQGKPVFVRWPHPIVDIIAAGFAFVDPASEPAKKCK